MLKLLWSSIFILCIKLLSSQANGFDQNPTNPGSGMNFYDPNPDTSVLRCPEVLRFEPSDCSEFYDNDSECSDIPDFCCEAAEPIDCDYSYPYHNYNGSCNNPFIASLGMAETCFGRLTPAAYEDDGGLRKSVKGGPLPEPRDISLIVLKNADRPSIRVTDLFTEYGQIYAHDLSQAVQPTMDCCKPENKKKAECMPISVRHDDPFYSKFHQTCLNFQRSEQCTLCKTDVRSQKNAGTAFLDAGIVYGGTEETALKLRSNDGTGKLKTSDDNLLPAGKETPSDFCPKEQASDCSVSGDGRVDMHISLTVLQTILLRLHNLIAEKLKLLNPHWEEEKLFQEARKILIAIYQCIAYKEYLPILLGPYIIEAFDLSVRNGAEGTLYNPKIKPGTLQEFAVGSFRLHSMVPTYNGVPNVTFKDTFSNPSMVRRGCLYDVVRGSINVPSQKYDRHIIPDLSNYLTKQPGQSFGSDLSAVDIQRGRDHGLSPYVELVKFCSGGTIILTCFDDLYGLGFMPSRNIELLEKMYKDAKDVDPWVGMQLEYHYPGSLLGPTATCVNTIQFYSAQKGDWFYFDNEGPGATFTPDQRSAIKQCSIARVLCDTSENKMKYITRNPFLLRSNDNPLVSCNNIPECDLTQWQESNAEDDC